MAQSGICPVCKQHRKLTRHHIFRSAVWRDYEDTQEHILLVCRSCHDLIEQEVTKRENEILQKHQELYVGVIEDFTGRNHGSIQGLYNKSRKRFIKNAH